MTATTLELLGALVACGAAAAALLLRDARARYGATGVALAAALALVAGQVWEQPRFEDVREQPELLLLGGVLAGVALGAATATFVRAPAAFAIAAFALVPLRLPIQVGGETNFLLVPLYGVIAGGWLRAVWLLVAGRGAQLQSASSPTAGEGRVARWLAIALAALLVAYAIGIAWSDDGDYAIRTVAFFLAPFAALLVLLRDLRWHRKLVGQVVVAVVAMALVFGAVGLYQSVVRDLSLNKHLQDANQLHLYFRVNSVFRDPNVLGRYLVFAIVAVAAWIAWRRPAREALAGFAIAAALLCGLAFTYSQTSFVALIAGLGVLTWFRFGWPGLGAATGMVAVAAVGLAVIGGPPDDAIGRKQDLGEATSGRANLISGGIELFERRPLAGQGSGAFAISFRRQIKRIRRPISHTEPITVAAEQGVLGLVPYGAVVVLSVMLLCVPWPGSSAARAGVAACFVVLLVHSIGYAGFAIDPAMWVLLALGFALRPEPD